MHTNIIRTLNVRGWIRPSQGSFFGLVHDSDIIGTEHSFFCTIYVRKTDEYRAYCCPHMAQRHGLVGFDIPAVPVLIEAHDFHDRPI